MENIIYTVPISEKVTLSVKEAAAYSGIGEGKIRALCENDENADFVLHIGSHIRIKRAAFERFIQESTYI